MIWPLHDKTHTRYWLKVFGLYVLVEACIQLLFYYLINHYGQETFGNVEFHVIMWFFQCLLIWPIWWVAHALRKKSIALQLIGNLVFFVAYSYLWFYPVQQAIAFLHQHLQLLTRPEGQRLPTTIDNAADFNYVSYQFLKHAFRISWFFFANYFYHYRREESKRIQLDIANKELQLRLLKWHLNPDFYFKTIDYLKNLSATSPASCAKPILQLAHEMEHVIYGKKEKEIDISKEINFLNEYTQSGNQLPSQEAPGPISGSAKKNNKIWFWAFLIYASLEVVYWTLNYVNVYMPSASGKCAACLWPVPYYVMQCLLGILFTAFVWYTLNRFYYRKGVYNVLVNLVVFGIHLTGFIFINYCMRMYGPSWLVPQPSGTLTLDNFIQSSWNDTGKFVFRAALFYVLKYYINYRRSEQQRLELSVINKDLQLNLFKQQLSPHFYFNTLNNLYGLARSNSPKLSTALHQLSNIMQYVIVDCNQPKVRLAQEISFLQSYIALEKLRYESNTVIDMQVRGEVNGQSILPLMLIQFVENAFKHGMKEKSENNWMKVNVVVAKEDLLFTVDNSYYAGEATEGIGIASVKHRLNLQYDGNYDMKMSHEGNRYSVTLKLHLT
jgi:sensor histidine kinase YesM